MIPEFRSKMTEDEAGNYSPLVLAFLGDAVYELVIRTSLVKEANEPVNKLNKKKSALVKAERQSAMIEGFAGELTPREESVLRRGRNAKSYTSAKNASIQDYRRATGFEALMGYLYLTGQEDRMLDLIRKGLKITL